MKRYWKIISLSIITVIVIGTFYLQSSLAANENAKVEFEKISGNENEVKNLTLHADYVIGNMHQSLKITTEETINLSNQSMLQELIKNNSVSILEKLIEQNRGFMRGKELMPNNFYEDEDLLVYASIKVEDFYEQPTRDFTFDIEALNKKSEETTTIQLDMPNKENYNWMNLFDVQVIDGKLKVISIGGRTDGGSDLNVYTIDIDEQKLVNDEIIHSSPTVENGWSDIRIFNDFYYIQPQKNLLIKIEAFEDENVHGEGEMDGEPNLVANKVIVYDIENNQSKKIVVPDEILGSIGDSSAIFNSTIFIPSQSANGLEVNQYDIENDKWGKKLTFDLPHTEDSEDAPYIKLMNGKIYIIHSTNDGHSIFIGDLKTGESIYEGKLNVKNQREDQKDYLLYIHEIEYLQ